ncbi:hypothetical protein C4A76_08140 [Brevibacillus laterosporus]|uniref:Uncharacterized protein n=1 Tax=Brevibacillus laterosporus TaxID=1465 RepID=A0AAP8Q8W6_BRELA|nr:hypothetical protein C4A76_08140 [Brevibacillus laterosporus]PPA91249.1 hypothetical protein C4A77_23840 [Brevibacillus laterosporus]
MHTGKNTKCFPGKDIYIMKINVYYDYLENRLAPLWYVITFRETELDWNKERAYIPITAPFQRKEAEDFDPDLLGLTVTLGDLLVHPEKPGKFGINLRALKEQAERHGVDHQEIRQFVLQVGDIEEVLQMRLISDKNTGATR